MVSQLADFDECKYYPWFDIKKETPAGVGGAHYGAALGVSVLDSLHVASPSNARYGGALASKNREIAIYFAISLPKFGILPFAFTIGH